MILIKPSTNTLLSPFDILNNNQDEDKLKNTQDYMVSIKNSPDNKVISLLCALSVSSIITLYSSLFIKKKEYMIGLLLILSIVFFLFFLNHEVQDSRDICGFFYSMKINFALFNTEAKMAGFALLLFIWLFIMCLKDFFIIIKCFIFNILVFCIIISFILQKNNGNSVYNLFNHLLLTYLVFSFFLFETYIIYPKYKFKYMEIVLAFSLLFIILRVLGYIRSSADFSLKNMDLFQRLAILVMYIFDKDPESSLDIVTDPVLLLGITLILFILYKFHFLSFMILLSIIFSLSFFLFFNSLLTHSNRKKHNISI